MNIQNGGYLSIEQVTEQLKNKTTKTGNKQSIERLSFQDILQQKSKISVESNLSEVVSGELKFSKHALNRLNDRNIQLNTEQLDRLNDGAKKAGEKGIRDSLVIVDQLAFIVNVPNKTVVTAMDSTATDENIFTNINGAVIA